jgi:hypothetical protein
MTLTARKPSTISEEEHEDDEDVEQELLDDIDADGRNSSPVDDIDSSPSSVPALKAEREDYLLELCEYDEYEAFVDAIFTNMVCIMECDDGVL